MTMRTQKTNKPATVAASQPKPPNTAGKDGPASPNKGRAISSNGRRLLNSQGGQSAAGTSLQSTFSTQYSKYKAETLKVADSDDSDEEKVLWLEDFDKERD